MMNIQRSESHRSSRAPQGGHIVLNCAGAELNSAYLKLHITLTTLPLGC
jgi:hypothetical protein